MSAWLRSVARTRCSSPGEWAVLMAIAVHAADEGGVAWPSVRTLADMTGLSGRHVTSMVGRLAARGVLVPAPVPEDVNGSLPTMRRVRTRAWRVDVSRGASTGCGKRYGKRTRKDEMSAPQRVK